MKQKQFKIQTSAKVLPQGEQRSCREGQVQSKKSAGPPKNYVVIPMLVLDPPEPIVNVRRKAN